MEEELEPRRGFSERSPGRRFRALSLFFALFFGSIALLELLRERVDLDRELRELTQAQRVGLIATLDATRREMQHLSLLLAVDPEVRDFLTRAHEAVLVEGGAAGGPIADRVRREFAQRMEQRREMRWSEELAARQIEFHILPGAVNFLRVRNPERFGDSSLGVRPAVSTVHAFDIPVAGFEVGRMYAGLRGIHPVHALDEGGPLKQVGSVEVGVALRDLLSYAAVRLGAEFALALPPDLVDGVMWPDDVRAGFTWLDGCACYVDSAYGLPGAQLLASLPDPRDASYGEHRLVSIDDRWYAVTLVSLAGYQDLSVEGAQPRLDAAIYIFSDRSATVASYAAQRLWVLSALVLTFLLTMLAAWVVLRRIHATEQALETARHFRSALFRLSPDSVLVADRTGTIVEVNPRFCEVTGYAADEVVGKNARILQSGNTPVETYRQMWDSLLSGREWRGDLQNRRKDGSLFWDAHAVVPVRDAAGEITHFVSFQRDISERHDMERALTASERLYRSIHDNVQESIFLVRVEGGEFVYVGNNPRHERSTGLTGERLCGARPRDILPPEAAEAVAANYRRCVAERQTIRYEEELDLPAGRRHWATSLAPVFNDAGDIEMIVGLSVDVTEQKRAEAELRRLATTDVLTGLANRRHFLERAAQELGRVRRYDTPSAFIMLDIDHFKRINDTWGHATGDAVLRSMAAVLAAAVRGTDLIGRLGGEEFGVLLPETGLEAALVLAERLREAVTAEEVAAEGESLRFSASFGVTLLHADDDSVDTPMARADAALYAAKFAGRNRVKWRVR